MAVSWTTIAVACALPPVTWASEVMRENCLAMGVSHAEITVSRSTHVMMMRTWILVEAQAAPSRWARSTSSSSISSCTAVGGVSLMGAVQMQRAPYGSCRYARYFLLISLEHTQSRSRTDNRPAGAWRGRAGSTYGSARALAWACGLLATAETVCTPPRDRSDFV